MANFFSGLFGQKNKPQSADHGAEANQADEASSYIEQKTILSYYATYKDEQPNSSEK